MLKPGGRYLFTSTRARGGLAVAERGADGHGPAPERFGERLPSAAGPAAYDRTGLRKR